MADKLTQQITDALTRLAAEPTGLPLYAGKADAGLFPNTASAKPAAQKCLTDELVRAVGTDTKGKTPRDLYGLTEKGWEFLLAAVNPKQVLEDFVRVLEARQGEVGELLDTARRMADSLQGLKDAVSRVLPGVSTAKLQQPNPPTPFPGKEGGVSESSGLSPSLLRGGVGEGSQSRPTPPAPLPEGKGEEDLRNPNAWAAREGFISPFPSGRGAGGVGLLCEPDLEPAVLAYLADHSGATDCALPELFRALSLTDTLTIGAFHDCLRKLYADGTVSLPAWTGPLYALPEPQYALLIGHGIAYYASLKG